MTISQQLYNEVMMVDNFTCVYCGRRGKDMVIDHFVPQSLGGPDVIHNLMTSCPECNGRKGDRPLHVVGLAPRYGRFSRQSISSGRYSWRKQQTRPQARPHARIIVPEELQALIGVKLSQQIAPSNIAKSLPGYTPSRYKEFSAKVQVVKAALEAAEAQGLAYQPLSEERIA